MMHKLRNAMGKRDDGYELYGEMELDDGFFSTPVAKDQKEEPLKRGRGLQKKTTVLVMTESEKVRESKKGKKSRKVGHIKMKVVSDLKSATINKVVSQCVSKDAHLDTDDSTSYVGLADLVKEHVSKVIPHKEINKELPWVHIAISWLLSNFHKINEEYQQYYLDEFCYNFNRRCMIDNLFDRLLVACVASKMMLGANADNHIGQSLIHQQIQVH
jgi:hypothetical protein